MNNQGHISRAFWVKLLKFFDGDSGSGMKIRTRDRDENSTRSGSACLGSRSGKKMQIRSNPDTYEKHKSAC
jgi:hypothetical protein